MAELYFADLAACNNGQLHGVWVDPSDGADAMSDAIAEMLAASPVAGADEAAIHDTDDVPPFIADAIGEDLTIWEQWADARQVAIDDHGAEVVAAWETFMHDRDHHMAGRCWPDVYRELDDYYVGVAESAEAWAMEHTYEAAEARGDNTDILQWIDWESLWNHDLRHYYDAVPIAGGGVAVFCSDW